MSGAITRRCSAPLVYPASSVSWYTRSTMGAPSGRKPMAAISSPLTHKRWEWHCQPQMRPMTTAAAAAAGANAEGFGIQPEVKAQRAPRAPRKKKDVMTLTEAAVKRIIELLDAKDPKPHGIRLGVRTRGCNGLSYTLNYVDEPQKLDEIVEAQGVKVYVDPKAVMHLIGTRMDFVEDAVKAEFVFENPNAKGACGCGESFNV